MVAKLSGVSGVSGTPCVTMYIKPRPMLSEPSVAMNGGSRITVMSTPLNRPNSRPVARPPRRQRAVGSPAWKPIAVTSEESPITDPTDRSMPPVMITITMPIDMMAISEKERNTPIRLSVVRK